MAGSMKDIKRRIKSVESTAQITKAMELVASSKLRHAKERAQAAEPCFELLYRTMCDIATTVNDFSSPFVGEKREIKTSLFIVIAGDRGLAGGYNHNIIKLADGDMKGKNVKIIAIGKKAIEAYEGTGKIVAAYPDFAEEADSLRVKKLSDKIVNMYINGEADEITVYYTEFISALTQAPLSMKILPLNAIKNETGVKNEWVHYEPSPEEVFEQIVPQFVHGVMYGSILESYASEQGARRTAMESASDNASEMIDNLSLSYNRARQAAITQEITEIVSGANVK